METYSKDHLAIKNVLYMLAKQSKNLDEFVKLLRKNKIAYQDCSLASGRELLIFTGSSGYDIAGCSVKYQNKEILIEDM